MAKIAKSTDPVRKTFPMLLKQAGKKIMEWETWVDYLPSSGYGRITVRYGYRDGEKQEAQTIVEKGKNEGRKNATTPYQQSLAEAEADWKKHLERKGYGLTVDDSAAVRGRSPMLAAKYEDVVKEVDWATAFAQPKLDGFRCLATKQGGNIILRSRENKTIATMDHIVAALEPIMEGLPDGAILDGELYIHNTPFQTIASAVKKVGDLTQKVGYHVYDTMSEASFRDRWNMLRNAKITMRQEEPVLLVSTAIVRSKEDLMVYQSECLSAGYEGAMLRHTRLGYQAGKRSKTLLKVKTFMDEEFEVVDAKQGTGTHVGMAIFTCETKEGHPFDVTAPGTHDEKRAYWRNWRNYVGRKLTVKYFELTTSEERVPRFPVAIGFRKD